MQPTISTAHTARSYRPFLPGFSVDRIASLEKSRGKFLPSHTPVFQEDLQDLPYCEVLKEDKRPKPPDIGVLYNDARALESTGTAGCTKEIQLCVFDR